MQNKADLDGMNLTLSTSWKKNVVLADTEDAMMKIGRVKMRIKCAREKEERAAN